MLGSKHCLDCRVLELQFLYTMGSRAGSFHSKPGLLSEPHSLASELPSLLGHPPQPSPESFWRQPAQNSCSPTRWGPRPSEQPLTMGTTPSSQLCESLHPCSQQQSSRPRDALGPFISNSASPERSRTLRQAWEWTNVTLHLFFPGRRTYPQGLVIPLGEHSPPQLSPRLSGDEKTPQTHNKQAGREGQK